MSGQPVRALAAAAVAIAAVVPGPTQASLDAWNAYAAALEARVNAEAAQPAAAALPEDVRRALARGEITIDEPRLPGTPPVPDASLHHWRGRTQLPGMRLDRLIAIVRDPASHTQDDVLEARVLARNGDTDRVFLKLRRSAIVTAAYNTEHTVEYRRVRPGLVLSRSVATRIAEIDRLGSPDEREKPPGTDRGFLWRMNAYWRYEEHDDGVLVTLESITLSRDVPWALSPVASPIINRIARESVRRTLQAIRQHATP